MADNNALETEAIIDAEANNNENIENNMIENENPVDAEEAIEAILFAAGHPISYATLARVLNLTPGKVRDIVADYSFKYNSSEFKRGVILLTYQDSCQLCTKKNYLPEIREALGIRKSGTLSTSSMEALAIVAYNQPVTRVFVDTLRRADSSYAMNNLLDRGLIECKGRLDVPGRPMLYGTTHDFLRSFGLDSLDSLPATTEELIAVFENAKTDTGLDPAALEAQNEGLINEATATQKTIDDIEGELEAEATVEAVSEDVTELEDMGADDDLANDIE